MHKSITPSELVALYAIADICLICSTRDGLNLVSYEFIACQLRENKPKGVLVISKYAGASEVLPKDSMVVVNPWDTDSFAEQIKDALEMGEEKRGEMHGKANEVVSELTSFHWGRAFVAALKGEEMGSP